MIHVEEAVLIERPLADVFAFVATNYVQNQPKWTSEVQEFRQTSRGSLRVGTTIHQVRTVSGRPVESDIEITAYEPNSELSYETGWGPVSVWGSYTFYASRDDRTQLVFIIEMQIADAPREVQELAAQRTRAEMAGDLRRLKGLMEGRAP